MLVKSYKIKWKNKDIDFLLLLLLFMLLGALGTSLFGSMLAGKGVIKDSEGTDSYSKTRILILPHPLIN